MKISQNVEKRLLGKVKQFIRKLLGIKKCVVGLRRSKVTNRNPHIPMSHLFTYYIDPFHSVTFKSVIDLDF